MTDKECISGLEVLKQIPHAKNFIEHIDMAIKVVEQQQNIHDTCKKCVEFSEFEQQPCEDCVSRAEVYDIITALFTSVEITHELWKETIQLVKELPSVTPQIKKGKWDKKLTHVGWAYKCSVCGSTKAVDSKFCPNCGAKMEVEE